MGAAAYMDRFDELERERREREEREEERLIAAARKRIEGEACDA